MAPRFVFIDHELEHHPLDLLPDLDFRIKLGYILSDDFTMIGFSSLMSLLHSCHKKMTGREIATIVRSGQYRFISENPLLKILSSDYWEIDKAVRSAKRTPMDLYVEGKKLEKKLQAGAELLVHLFDETERINKFTAYGNLISTRKITSYALRDETKPLFKQSLNFEKLMLDQCIPGPDKNSIWLINHYYYSDIFTEETDEPDNPNTDPDENENLSPTENTTEKSSDNLTELQVEDLDNVERLYFHPLLAFPDISKITLEELEAVKEGLREPMQEIMAFLSEWAQKCYANENSAAFVFNNTEALFKRAQTALDNNLIINQYKNTDGKKTSFKIYLTELLPYQFAAYNAIFGPGQMKDFTLTLENIRHKENKHKVPTIMVWPESIPFTVQVRKKDFQEIFDALEQNPKAIYVDEVLPTRKKLALGEDDA